MIDVEKKKRAEEKEDHLKQIEEMKKEINKQEEERWKDYNDLLKQMNEKLKSAQPTFASSSRKEEEVKETFTSSSAKDKKVNDEDLQGLDRLLKMNLQNSSVTIAVASVVYRKGTRKTTIKIRRLDALLTSVISGIIRHSTAQLHLRLK
jgi:hypothetical protein